MDVDWTDAEKHDLGFTLSGHAGGNTLNAALAVASRAVSLFLARASGQVKDDTAWLRRHVGGDPGSSDAAISRLSALAQEAVALKTKGTLKERLLESVTAQREELKGNVRAIRAEVERLKGWREKCINDNNAWAARLTAAESRLAAILERYADGVGVANAVDRDRRQAAEYEVVHTEASAVMAGIRWVLGGDTPQEVKANGSLVIGDDGAPVLLTRDGTRYPCSATCTHEDAANPGHPARVKERSEAFSKSMDDAKSIADSVARAREAGAEAMRAALLIEAKAACDQHGVGWLYQHLKRRFEGATT